MSLRGSCACTVGYKSASYLGEASPGGTQLQRNLAACCILPVAQINRDSTRVKQWLCHAIKIERASPPARRFARIEPTMR